LHWRFTISIIGKFAEILKKTLEVIKQLSHNAVVIVKLHDHAVDISDGLLPHVLQLSRITVFDNGLNNLINTDSQKQFYTKVMSATDTKLVTQVDIYIKNLTF
jgi:thiamine monophosphate kinase